MKPEVTEVDNRLTVGDLIKQLMTLDPTIVVVAGSRFGTLCPVQAVSLVNLTASTRSGYQVNGGRDATISDAAVLALWFAPTHGVS
ncbi:MAG: hypothetical protein JWR75_1479 [Devosia sp.]|nr:hypothetical protein [Devosia sp.]